RDGAGHIELAAGGVVVGDADGGLDLQLVAGVAGDDVDQTTGGVTAEQGALGPLQHFDAFDVVELEHRRLHVGDVDAVHVDGVAALFAGTGTGVADAADEEHRHRTGVHDLHAGGDLRQGDGGVDTGIGQGVGLDRHHRNGHLLQVLRA